MESHVEIEVAWLDSLSPAERSQFLMRLAHGLTIGVRVLCNGDREVQFNLESVRVLNEGLHRVLGHLLPIHGGNQGASWLATIVESVLCTKDAAASQQASQAWSYAKNTAVPQSAA